MANDPLGMLHLVIAEPTLLLAAPPGDQGCQIEHRRCNETHPCLRCGQRARLAYIVETPIGPRWLDLCPACDYALQRALIEDEAARPAHDEEMWRP